METDMENSRSRDRLRTFIWLIYQEALNTNSRRAIWSGDSGLCPLRGSEMETNLHAIQDCLMAQRVWNEVVELNERTNFYVRGIIEWIRYNMSKRDDWITKWSIICWLIWQWRNKEVFEETFIRPRYLQYAIQFWFKAFRLEDQQQRLEQRGRVEIIIKWSPPEEGWCKINSDGAKKDNTRKGGCGGVIRDTIGQWKVGYDIFLGNVSVFLAEAWGVMVGMETALKYGQRKVIMEMDSESVFHIVKDRERCSKNNLTVFRRIDALSKDFERIIFKHTMREGNTVADFMENLGIKLDGDLKEWLNPPNKARGLLIHDVTGLGTPRFISC